MVHCTCQALFNFSPAATSTAADSMPHPTYPCDNSSPHTTLPSPLTFQLPRPCCCSSAAHWHTAVASRLLMMLSLPTDCSAPCTWCHSSCCLIQTSSGGVEMQVWIQCKKCGDRKLVERFWCVGRLQRLRAGSAGALTRCCHRLDQMSGCFDRRAETGRHTAGAVGGRTCPAVLTGSLHATAQAIGAKHMSMSCWACCKLSRQAVAPTSHATYRMV